MNTDSSGPSQSLPRLERPSRPVQLDPSPGATPRVAAQGHVSAEEAWGVLVPYRSAVVRFLRRRCRDEHLAEDLAHDALLKATRYCQSLRRVARPGAWLIQIAANIQRDFLTKEMRHSLMPPTEELFLELQGSEPIPGDVPETTYYSIDGVRVGGDLLVAEIMDLWGGMSERDRRVIAGFYSEDGSTALAAKNCGIDRGLVKIRLFRARRRLEADLRQRLRCA